MRDARAVGGGAGVSSLGEAGRGSGGSGGSATGAAGVNAVAGSSASAGSSSSSGGTAGQGGADGNSKGGAGGAASGSGGGAPASSDCPAPAQLCLDFEDGGFEGWTKKENGGTVSVDGATAFRGSHSLLVNTPGGKRGGHLEARLAPLFPLPSNKLWGRMMIQVDGVPDGHTNFASASGKGGGSYNVSEQHGSFMMSYYGGSAATDCWARPKNGVKVPNKKWMCWEWSFDGEKNRFEYWLDGTSLVVVDGKGDGCLSGNGTWGAPQPFEALQIGEEIQQPGGGDSRVWIDDVAVSNQGRVACPTP